MTAEPQGRQRRHGRRVAVALIALAAVGAAGAGAVALSQDGTEPAPGAPAIPVATTTVTRTDLSNSINLSGRLGFGAARPVRGAGTGTLTRLPAPGSPVTRGRPLYWVNDRPVVAFYGSTPLFRKLGQVGMIGRDVTLVADNLTALGYDVGSRTTGASVGATEGGPGATAGAWAGATAPERTATGDAASREGGIAYRPPGDVFTASLKSALRRWQADSGLPPTGTLDVGQIVVFPGRARVDAVKAQQGDPVAGDILTVTGTAKVATISLNASDAGIVRKGERVTMVLPDDKKIAAKVTAMGKTVQESSDSSDQNEPQVSVTVTPVRSSAVKALDSAPVDVVFTTRVHKNVLAVPVSALLALREGGYALQARSGALIAATTGMYARGMVEVSGPGIVAGLTVVTSS
ncbi:hypothetical protein JOL79_12115 [Microbispora sp. RL4-1S]|uniref:Peptidoglycan-binding protein n=1 Tax=Microbispora oryzae TaxID=2806554 RepID=A0A941AHX1_9ACTN|nr:hypothetical protein [Microbispora oryzae]MBP2704560.1 hypothetical protein [Microbispora oryzae]